MDFSYLLELAKNNEERSKVEAGHSRFSTKVSAPKKLAKPTCSSDAIRALKEKKAALKNKQNEEFKKKRENLLALRAQDKKSHKRVSAMINRTKGASKAVLDDAKDLTTACGEEQCDEDDYGYESAMSQQIFSKLANRYANIPEDDKLKFVKKAKGSIDDIKSRVMSSLKQEELEEMTPRKRKRRSKGGDGDDFINDGDAYAEFPESDKKPKSSSSSKMPVNINLTNYKSDKYNNFKYEEKKERKEKEERSSYRKEEERSSHRKEKKKSSSKSAPPPMSFEAILKMAKDKQTKPSGVVQEEEKKKTKDKDKKELDRPLTAKEKEEMEEERRRKLRRMGKLPPEKKEPDKTQDKGKKTEEKKDVKPEPKAKEKPKPEPKPEPKVLDRSKYFAVPAGSKPPEPKKPTIKQEPTRDFPPKTQKSRDFPPRDFPPRDLKPQKAPRDKGRPFPPADVRRAPVSVRGGRIESDSEEYDSELDDFIDDGEEELDYSSEIKKMFGYDKSKYQDEDDDCADMEASYTQMQKEERYSAKVGLMEDLEDIKREEEERKAKMMRLKKMKKGR